LTFLLVPGLALAQAPFYQGKTITWIRGSTPGGIGEWRTRSLLPYVSKHIPGNPTIVIEFMPGAGGRKAVNYVYGRARPDGLTIGSTGGGVITSAILGEIGVQYDLNKLIFLGSSESENHYTFVTRQEFDSIEKLRNTPGVRIGAHSVGHLIYITGRLFAYFLDLKEPRFVTGYSSPEQDVALLRGEIDGRSMTSADLMQRQPEWVERSTMHFHATIEIPKGLKFPVFSHLPDLEKFVRSEREQKLLTMFRAMRAAGSPFFIAPGTRKERVRILQAAFRKAYEDPDFHKQYRKMTGVEPSPIRPEEHEAEIRGIPRDPDTVELYKRFSGGDPLPSR
jgi:tripartite-type tricarboxylate transporter receptor subunit TctC